MRSFVLAAIALPFAFAAACGGEGTSTTSSGPGGSKGSASSSSSGGAGGADTSTKLVFDVAADLTKPEQFYDRPFPADTRLATDGSADYTGFPLNAMKTLGANLKTAIPGHKGFAVVQAGYFRFTGKLAARSPDDVIPAVATSPILLIDVDPKSDENGKLYPVVATTPSEDAYVPSNLLAVGPRPGIVLKPHRAYAYVVLTSLDDAAGKPLGIAKAMADLEAGNAPEGAKDGNALKAIYASLWSTLGKVGVAKAQVAAATVFTTGDVVQDLADLGDALLAKYSVTIDNLKVDPDDGAQHPRFCELHATVKMPQFQKGTPPFDTEGLFDFSDNGLPAKQRDETIPVAITLPKGEMPKGGYPLVMYFHGSGGRSTALVDRGTWHPEPDPAKCPDMEQDTWMGVKGCNTKGEGPAHVLAPFGFAMAGGALPVNPERVPGAGETAYLNFQNLAMGRDLFRQGVIEQRLYLKALRALEIDPSVVASCSGLTMAPGETKFHFDSSHVYAQGQSMGGQYTNLFSATEPLVLGAVATGAGGYWSHFVMHTPLIANNQGFVGAIVAGAATDLTYLHPALQLYELAWEPVDPMVYMARVGKRPLAKHPARPVYDPAAIGDSFFPTVTYDAMALAYGDEEAGKQVWTTLQDALKLGGLDGIQKYPVKNNVKSDDGRPRTSTIVLYEGDGIYDPHAIYSQLDDVKYQYSCFLSTLFANGAATVPAPAPLGTPCPN